eukprot:gene33861-43696_t
MKTILFIGANDMHEIDESFINKYDKGIFIEAIPEVYDRLENRLKDINEKYNVNYECINRLVTNEEHKLYTFHIFNNKGMSSSIYQADLEHWIPKKIKEVDSIELKSTKMSTILSQYDYKNFDTIIDVQGAELEVLKGFEEHIQKIDRLIVEVSKVAYYKGQCTWKQVDRFLLDNKFKRITMQ